MKESILFLEDKMEDWRYGTMMRESAILRVKGTQDRSIRWRFHPIREKLLLLVVKALFSSGICLSPSWGIKFSLSCLLLPKSHKKRRNQWREALRAVLKVALRRALKSDYYSNHHIIIFLRNTSNIILNHLNDKGERDFFTWELSAFKTLGELKSLAMLLR